jgi:hypothetical protein
VAERVAASGALNCRGDSSPCANGLRHAKQKSLQASTMHTQGFFVSDSRARRA